MSLPPPEKKLLPDAFAHPLVMLITGIFPQLALLYFNIVDAGRLRELLAEGPWRELMVLTGTQGFLMLAGLVMTLPPLFRGKSIPMAWMPVWLAGCVGFAIAGVLLAGRIVDANTAFWLEGTDVLGLRQALLVLPGAFVAGLRIACMPLRLTASRDIMTSVAVMAGIPAAWYLFFTIFSSTWRNAPSETASVVLFSLTTILVLLALMRLVAMIARRWTPKEDSVARAIWMVIFGLIAPLGGLLLNEEIPFPFTFQHPAFYPIAILNGILLMIPTPRTPAWRSFLLFARAALFPYVFYFFIIFLPFTPFFLPALFFFGAGVLILAPTALFLVQGALLWQGFREMLERKGRVRAVALMVLAFSLLPGAIFAQAVWHRSTLHHALDYVYPGENTPPAVFTSNRHALRAVLDNQARSRSEASIPFISTWYNSMVFDGLMLPKKKLDTLYHIFFQAPPPDFERQEDWGIFSSRSAANNNRDTWGPPPPLTGRLTGITWSSTQDDGFRRIHADVHLHNPGSQQAEYADTIHLPPGALITGFWLHIEEERVPGIIFEKKTAMWVYQTIRDRTRRDPGILVYKNDGSLDFRVFPLERDQHRRVEIEFSIPDAVAGEVVIGAEKFPLSDKRTDGLQVIRIPEGGVRIMAGPDTPLPRFLRDSVVHIIVSPSAQNWEAHLREAATTARTQYQVGSVHLHVGNHDLGEVPAEEGAALAAARASTVAADTPFFQARAVRHALWHAMANTPTKRPVILFAPSGPLKEHAEEKLDRLQALVPDALIGHPGNDSVTQPEVALIKVGGQTLAALPGPGGWEQSFPSAPSNAPVEIVHSKTGEFVAFPEAHLLPSPAGIMQTGTALWIDQVRADTGIAPPKKSFADRVRASRDMGVMLTSTSYIVVEQKAQWQALKEKEAAKLAAHAAFDPGEIIDTPEPHALLWLLLLLLWGGWKSCRPKIRVD